MRVCFCPPAFPLGYYWYGANRHSEGTLPRWIENLIKTTIASVDEVAPITKEPEDSDSECEFPDSQEPESASDVLNTDLHLPDLFEPDRPLQRNEKTKYPLRKRITKPSRLYSSLGSSFK